MRRGYSIRTRTSSLAVGRSRPTGAQTGDPVLNLASSYIWHLCCIRRDAALREGLYTDPGATWCHDWDTSFRIARSGEAPLHVPEVLYHCGSIRPPPATA